MDLPQTGRDDLEFIKGLAAGFISGGLALVIVLVAYRDKVSEKFLKGLWIGFYIICAVLLVGIITAI